MPLYAGIVALARSPHLYTSAGVPDTPDGRLEMIGLHAAVVMRRLGAAGMPGAALAQALFDLMFADVDHSFREQGVGDLSVGKHVKRAAATFLARSAAVAKTLDGEMSDDELAQVITYNLGVEGDMRAVVEVLRDLDDRLRSQPEVDLLDGRLSAGSPVDQP